MCSWSSRYEGYRTGSVRDFDPYGLVFHKGCWSAVGHDHLRGEIRPSPRWRPALPGAVLSRRALRLAASCGRPRPLR